MLRIVPWLAVALIIYNVAVFALSPAGEGATVFDREVMQLSLLSGAEWALSLGDLVVMITLFLFFIEIVKASINFNTSLADQALSMGVFIICLIEFLTVPQAATSVFFVILFLALMDVMTGFIIQIRFARRDVALDVNTG